MEDNNQGDDTGALDVQPYRQLVNRAGAKAHLFTRGLDQIVLSGFKIIDEGGGISGMDFGER